MIHLVNMPFTSLTHPNLALGLFKSQLAGAGMESDVFNFNLDFARRIGYSGYETIAFFKGVETQISEWLFTRAAWGDDFGVPEDAFLDLCGEELQNIPKVDDVRGWLRQIRDEVVPQFLEDSLALLESRGELRVVGFSCTFFQTVASLALGKLIKTRYPHVKVVYGGACFHGEMGDELMRGIPWIDAVSTGEADDVIVPLMAALDMGACPEGLHGILYRDATGTVIDGPPHKAVSRHTIADLPDPDFDSFFHDAARVGIDQDEGWRERLLIPFESSRGCWWGQKHHCKFCGLNGQGMNYRGKCGNDVYAMLERLTTKYPQAKRFQASDNILSVTYFKDMVPQLAEEPLPVELFYSVKSNMNRKQIKALADANILYVQPGIESFSSHILDLMDKGVSALQNLFFLKVCRDYGITPYWNNLIRLPGERQEDYDQMAAWMPLIVHIRPPYGGAPKIECHRFSPYFNQPDRWTHDIRPQAWYSGIFPADQLDLNRVAYYFHADWKNTLGDPAYDDLIDRTLTWIQIWKQAEHIPQLRIQPRGDGGYDLRDTRFGEDGLWQLDALETAIYQAIDAPANLRSVGKSLHKAGYALSEAEINAVLDEFVRAGITITDNGQWLAIAITPEAEDPPLWLRRGLLKHTINNQKAQVEPA